jgi:ubiquinone/menaquinone biosynthesis C-methylase UbiE
MSRFTAAVSMVASLTLASVCLAQPTAPAQSEPDGHPKIAPERIHRYERQDVVLDDFEASGYVLDIGGGGEGIIGLLKPSQVVAIDLSARELAQAPPGPLKIVMDATDLKFLDGTFGTATSFFTLMYMKPETQRRAIEEIHRVLVPGGRFLIWDLTLPAKADPVQDVAVFPLRIRMPGREVTTGYGTFFPDVMHDPAWFTAILKDAGFEVVTERVTGGTFFLEARKRPGGAVSPG